jgi:hypothetical protein
VAEAICIPLQKRVVFARKKRNNSRVQLHIPAKRLSSLIVDARSTAHGVLEIAHFAVF